MLWVESIQPRTETSVAFFYRDSGISVSIKAYSTFICRRTVGFSASTVLCKVATVQTIVFSVYTAVYGVMYCTEQQYTVLQSTECHSLNAQNNEALKTHVKHMPKSITITIVNQYVKHECNKQRNSCSNINISSLSRTILVKTLQRNQFAKNERPERNP